MSISCVIPAHFRAEYIGPALESIRAQTLLPTEVVVVSDVADQDTRRVCANANASAPYDVQYVEALKGLGGASASRNVGARATSGELIAFLDDDDLWAPTYLERVSEAAADDIDLVVTWLEEFSTDHRSAGPQIPVGLRAQDVASINPGATGSNIVVRRALFDRIGGFDDEQRVKNDTDFLFRALRGGARYAVVGECLVLQRKHFAGQLTAKTDMRARGVERYMSKHMHALTPKDVLAISVQIDRIRKHSARSAPARIFYAVRLGLRLGPSQVLRNLSARKNRKFVEVGALTDGVNQ